MGALGPVFRTYEPARDRLVAVKVLRLDITPEQAQALATEMSRAAEASLFHPSIVEPIAAGVEGTAAYRAEEYVAGESLDVAVRHYAPAPLDKVMPFITQLAGAIDFARAAGIGHGALHPRDIFVTPDEARATGFGVVEALERTGLRAPVRRPYTAPERVAGGAWTTTADVFSLAAIAYELLTGRRPAGTGDRFGVLGEGTPHAERIQRVLARAMSEEASARYSTALAFASALEAAARGEAETEATSAVDTSAIAPVVAPQAAPQAEPAAGEPESEAAPESAPDTEVAREDKRQPGDESGIFAGITRITPDRFKQPDDEAVLSADAMTRPAIVADIGDAQDELPLHRAERLEDDDLIANRAQEPGAGEEPPRERSAESVPTSERFRVLPRDSTAGEPASVRSPEPGVDKPFLVHPRPSGVEERVGIPAREPAAESRPSHVHPNESQGLVHQGESAVEQDGFRRHEPSPEESDYPPESAGEVEPVRGQLEEREPLLAHARDEAPNTEPLPSYLRQPAPDEASLRDYAHQGVVPDEYQHDAAGEAPRPAILPLALTLILGLLVGFAAGYVVAGREPQTVATRQAAAPPTTAPASGAQEPAGKQWSEQTVKPVPAPSTTQPPRAQTPTAAQPPAVAPPVPADAPRAGPATAPAKPPKEATAPTAGTLVVRSTPSGAGVTINGRWRGRTPLTIDDLPFARYVVRIVQPGYAPEREEVALSRASASRTLSVRLRVEREAAPPVRRGAAPAREPAGGAPLTASVYVASNPTGARVFIDGQFVGTAPLRVPDVHIGAHVVRMELPDHRTWSTSARIVAGGDNRVTGSLERIR